MLGILFKALKIAKVSIREEDLEININLLQNI